MTRKQYRYSQSYTRLFPVLGRVCRSSFLQQSCVLESCEIRLVRSVLDVNSGTKLR